MDNRGEIPSEAEGLRFNDEILFAILAGFGVGIHILISFFSSHLATGRKVFTNERV